MPIFIMAIVALAGFLVMGLMLFYAAYKEAHEPEAGAPPAKPIAH